MIAHEDTETICITTHRIDGIVYTVVGCPDLAEDRIIHPDGTIHVFPANQSPHLWTKLEHAVMESLGQI